MSVYFRNISFSRQLFISVLMLFMLFVVSFVAFQYHREKQYRIELLNTTLQDYNRQLEERLLADGIRNDSMVQHYLLKHVMLGMRLTLIGEDGEVFYDSKEPNRSRMLNHKSRKEIQEALRTGKGYDIRRTSETLQNDYFYSATYFNRSECIVRTALPYDVNLINSLSADVGYLWFTLALTFILAFIYYRYTRMLGKNITQLRQFAKQVECDEDWEEGYIPFPDSELGEISHHIVQLYTQLKKSEADKIRLKRQLTQNIAHELKTPVSSIQGYLETIVNNPQLTDERRQIFLERCYAQSNRLTSLLRDISVLTRMDEASQSFDCEPVNIFHLLHTVESDVALQMAEKNESFLILINPDVVIEGNSSLLYSMFRNLVDNAIAYAGQGITMTVKCTGEDSQYYYFSFADNGVGVSPEHLAHLFERFYRVDKGRSRKLGGTGLGLAIVKNAVLMHGGIITVSIASTGGLEFRFNLPKQKR